MAAWSQGCVFGTASNAQKGFPTMMKQKRIRSNLVSIGTAQKYRITASASWAICSV